MSLCPLHLGDIDGKNNHSLQNQVAKEQSWPELPDAYAGPPRRRKGKRYTKNTMSPEDLQKVFNETAKAFQAECQKRSIVYDQPKSVPYVHAMVSFPHILLRLSTPIFSLVFTLRNITTWHKCPQML